MGKIWEATDGSMASSSAREVSTIARVERAVARAIEPSLAADGPRALRGAIAHAVFPGGARLRPRLALAVAQACGGSADSAEVAGAAVELMHCASLVHDDLPCFDDAAIRRGRPSVHAAFGEATALLVGDALIVAAFETLVSSDRVGPETRVRLVREIARGAGTPAGIIAGQAFESEEGASLRRVNRAKTGALFGAAAAAGAIVSGANAVPWRRFGLLLGEAYQAADDLADRLGDPARLGKPVRQDARRGRPSMRVVRTEAAARQRFELLLQAAVRAIPACAGRAGLLRWTRAAARRLVPVDGAPAGVLGTLEVVQ